ncbi:hypothetical protein [Catellatospora tritici]|nr:hypothetical protein [Catellatospora tritici]MBV1851404.1 hypothetical protein [Catellatospora tritici]
MAVVQLRQPLPAPLPSEVWAAGNGGSLAADATANFAADTSWLTATSWAP